MLVCWRTVSWFLLEGMCIELHSHRRLKILSVLISFIAPKIPDLEIHPCHTGDVYVPISFTIALIVKYKILLI